MSSGRTGTEESGAEQGSTELRGAPSGGSGQGTAGKGAPGKAPVRALHLPAPHLAAVAVGTWRRRLHWTVRAIVRRPVTVGLLVLIWALGLLTHSLISGPSEDQVGYLGVNLEGLRLSRFWTLLTSPLVNTGLTSCLLSSLLLVLGVGIAESIMGSRRTAAVFFGGHILAVLGFMSLAELAEPVDDPWLRSWTGAVVLGPYAGIIAAFMASTAFLGPLWRRRFRALTLAATLTVVLYIGHPAMMLGLFGLVAGWAGGRLLAGRRQPRPFRSGTVEVRTNLALVVAVTAVGPLLAGITRSPEGPLALVRAILTDPVPVFTELADRCSAGVDLGCLQLASAGGLSGRGGAGGVIVAIAPVLLLLVCAAGLRKGRVLALWTAIAVQVFAAALACAYWIMLSQLPRLTGHVPAHALSFSYIHLAPALLAPLTIAALLFAYRRRFTLSAHRSSLRRAGFAVVVTLAVLAAAYALAWVQPQNAASQHGLPLLLAELVRQFIPFPFPRSLGVSVPSHSAPVSWLYHYSGAIFWLVVLVAALRVFVTAMVPEDAEENARHRAAELARHGGGSLSHMALWEGNSYWFTPDGAAAVAYRLENNIALTVAGPLGPPQARIAAARGFVEFCLHRSWVPCFYSVTDEVLAALEPMGFRRLPVAEETLLHIQGLQFTGKKWQNVRTAINRAAKLEVQVRWSRYWDLPLHLRGQIDELCQNWVQGKAVPEMGFTLGSLRELQDREVLCGIAVDRREVLHAVTSWLPVYEEGRIVSWTLDVMRRADDGFSGVMEFLIASAVDHFSDFVDVISLSGTPLVLSPVGAAAGEEAGAAAVRIPEQEAQAETVILRRVLEFLAGALEPLYGFRSLASFKARFQPRHRTLYLLYRDPLALPAIGLAVGDAYLPDISVRQKAALVQRLFA